MIYTSKYEGHTPAPWECNDIEGREIWKCLFNGECFTDPSTYGRAGYEEVLIATMAPLPEGEDFPEEEFTRMMADKELMRDAPLLLAEVKRLRAENELYNMCIFASHYRDKPGSALRKLSQMRFNQRREEE